jgi:hypothetical protein
MGGKAVEKNEKICILYKFISMLCFLAITLHPAGSDAWPQLSRRDAWAFSMI